MRGFLLVTGAPILFLLLVRLIPRTQSEKARAGAIGSRPLPVGRQAVLEGDRS
jgi:hypothetical protein